MATNYLTFISDEHLLKCIENLFLSYQKAKEKISKKKFYANKVDTFKLTFDLKFNDIDEEKLIQTEILRQVDKSINNSIGTFHEEILAGIKGFEQGNLSGYDIRAKNNSLFADIKNKHNTMNSSSAESLFQKLAKYADEHKNAKCYWVQILAKKSFEEHWKGDINGKEYSHSRVFKISGDQFYYKLTGRKKAFYELYKVLPQVIDDFLKQNDIKHSKKTNSAFEEIKNSSKKSKLSIIDQITFENYGHYLGFKDL